MFDVNGGVQEFYTGQSILLTGATGFLGKVFIEKLLRTCPKIKRLYLLIRNKKGKDSHQRLTELFDDMVFSHMKEENVDYMEKVTLISGDITLPGNGISESDREMLIQEVTVVFHGAATVRFDENLATAVRINIYGTKQLLQFCSECCNLKAFVYISTAYSNCNNRRDVLKEIVYPPPISSDDLIKVVESLPGDQLEILTPLIIDNWPNTYSFSKQVTEDLVRSEAIVKNIRAAIFRPAIVIGAYSEPIPGWIDNLYGPTGVIVGVGFGVLRTMHANSNKKAELVPVDKTVNAALAVAWEVATSQRNISKKNFIAEDAVPVYNFTTSKRNSLTWGMFHELGILVGLKYSILKSVWYNTLTTTKYLIWFYFLNFFFHILPAIVVDSALLILGKKPLALKVYRKIYKYLLLISYFGTNEWNFQSENVVILWNRLSVKDKMMFNFDMDDIDWTKFFDNNLKIMRVIFAKETPDTIPAASRKMFRLYLLHRLVQVLVISTVAWFSWTLGLKLFNWFKS